MKVWFISAQAYSLENVWTISVWN